MAAVPEPYASARVGRGAARGGAESGTRWQQWQRVETGERRGGEQLQVEAEDGKVEQSTVVERWSLFLPPSFLSLPLSCCFLAR